MSSFVRVLSQQLGRLSIFCWPGDVIQEEGENVIVRTPSIDLTFVDQSEIHQSISRLSKESQSIAARLSKVSQQLITDPLSDVKHAEIHEEKGDESPIDWHRVKPSPSRPSKKFPQPSTETVLPSIPQLPLNVLVSMVAPFIADRPTLNAFTAASKELWNGCRDTIPFPPWPSLMLNVGSRLWSVAFSPANTLLAAGGTDGRIRLYDRWRGPFKTLTGHLGRVYSIVFTCEGKDMISLSGDGDVRIWDMDDYTLQRQVATHTTHSVCLALNRTAMKMATGGEGDIKLYSIPQGVGLDVMTLERNRFLVESVAFSPDGKFMAAGTGGHAIHVWDMATRECVITFQESSSVHSVVYSPDGQYLVSGTDARDIRVWNLVSRDYITLRGHRDLVWSVAYSPDGQRIASASDDGTVRLWCSKSGLCTDIMNGHADASVYSVAFSPDGRTVASTSNDGYIELVKIS